MANKYIYIYIHTPLKFKSETLRPLLESTKSSNKEINSISLDYGSVELPKSSTRSVFSVVTWNDTIKKILEYFSFSHKWVCMKRVVAWFLLVKHIDSCIKIPVFQWCFAIYARFTNSLLLCQWKMHSSYFSYFKGTVIQIEKSPIKDRLRISKVSWKFCVPTIFNFAIIYPWNLLFS